MASIAEIAPDLYRISWYWKEIDLQFNHFLLKDEQPLLFTTGFRGSFSEVLDALRQVLDPAKLRWISFSHFESDECGALNRWLAAAPLAEPVCSFTGALVNLTDFSDRPPRSLADGETLSTGRYRLRFCQTPHLPHGWDAGVLFEETQGVLLCSDLFHHNGQVEPLVQSDILGRVEAALHAMNASPMPQYMPWTPRTGTLLENLAKLSPRTLAIMHGSSFARDGASAIRDLAVVMKEVLGVSEDRPSGESAGTSGTRTVTAA
jgi:flavorubredoxin